jgi:putative ABC transport system permease protein
MLKSFFKLTLRNLLKRKWYSIINILGLATGMAACLVILEYVNLELNYDSFHTFKNQVYRTLTTSYRNGESRGTFPLSGFAQGPSLEQDYPDVEVFCRLHPQYGGSVVTAGEGNDIKQFFEEDMFYVDSTFFQLFSFQLIEGDLKSALKHPKSIVISESMSKKYFGNEEAMGKTMVLDGGWDEGEYKVTGILEDIPENTHLKFDFLMSIEDMLNNRQYREDDGWGWSNFFTYVKLNNSTDPRVLEAKLPEFVQKYEGEDLAQSNSNYIITLQPIDQIHLTPGLDEDIAATRSATTVYSFVIIALFILIIGWVNYINLATARALERAREVGIKKVVGSSNQQLISQFLMESAMLNIISMILAIVIATLSLPILGQLIGKSLSISAFSNLNFWWVVLGILVLGTFLAGMYPAFVLASYKPSAVLKPSQSKGGSGFTLRKSLVVFQFAASLALIAGTFAVYSQISFMRNQDLGLDFNQVVVVKGPNVLPEGVKFRNTYTTFKSEVLRIPGVLNLASSGSIPGGDFNWGTSMRRAGDEASANKSGNVTWVDDQFIATYDIKLIAGRNWDMTQEADRGKVIINETAISTFGLGNLDNALSEKIILGNDTAEIIGITADYNWTSLTKVNEPILLAPTRANNSYFSIKLAKESISPTLKEVEAQYKALYPGNPFDYFFIDDFFNEQYKSDQQFGAIFSIFAVLAVFVACLGLSGLASYTAMQRTKEIGVRKVLGASSNSIILLLSRNFILMVLIASVLVTPALVWGIGEWLDGYAYHITNSWKLYFLPLMILMVITLITVSLQTMRAAAANPAHSLRVE